MLSPIKRSVRYKLTLIILATTLVALIVTGIALVLYDLRAYHDAELGDLTAQAEILGNASAPALQFNDPETANENLTALRVRPKITSAAIYNAKGKLFASYTRRNLDLNLPQLPDSEGARTEGKSLVIFKRIVDNREILGMVYIKAEYEVFKRFVDYAGIFGAVTILSLFVALLISGWLQTAVTKPILNIAQMARQIIETKNFALRAKKTTDDEIGELANAFNDMLTEIGRRAEALQRLNQSLELEMVERKRTDEELQKLNAELEARVTARTNQLEVANKELEGFSYSVSHDLRAPLRAVVGFSKLLVEDHAEQLDEEARRKLKVIQDEAQRMGILIDDLLAFSRLGRKAIQPSTVDMTELARATFKGLDGHDGATAVDFQLASLPEGKGDRVLLGQVWANLLSNAVKFSAKRDKPRIEVSAVSDEKEHIYFVRDNGAGFDPRYQSKLFGVFQRLHDASEFPGTGVGLALVQRIVTRHGGRVWADGKPDAGATFYFTLPKEAINGSH